MMKSLRGGLAPNATVMSWRAGKEACSAAKHTICNYDAPLYCYFDYYQKERPEEPRSPLADFTREKVFDFNPIPEELTASESKFILGAQGICGQSIS